MKLDLSKPYQTRDGRKALVIVGPDGRLYGWCEQPGSPAEFDAETWCSDGQYHCGETGLWDLVNIPDIRAVKMWFNVYLGGGYYFIGHPSRESADAAVNNNERIACIERELTFTVGEGLE